jgi:5-methylthioribose kinase
VSRLPGARAFLTELRRLWPARLDTSFTDAVLATWVRTVWDDALGFAAAKMTRRMIDFAHVSDIETLDEGPRAVAVSTVLRIARRLLVERSRVVDPELVRALVEQELAGRS